MVKKARYDARSTAAEIFRVSLRRLRKTRKLTQEELARKVRVSPKYISHLETGDRANPSLDMIERLSSALAVPPAALLGAEPDALVYDMRETDRGFLKTDIGKLVASANVAELHAVSALFAATRGAG